MNLEEISIQSNNFINFLFKEKDYKQYKKTNIHQITT